MIARLARFVLLAAALAAAGCPPPPDVDSVRAVAQQPQPKAPGEPTSAPAPASPLDPAGPADEPSAPASEEPVAPVVTARPRQSVHERLAGGVFVARCAACGAVQPPSSLQCTACKQALRPWRQEWTCTVCAGSGACDRCGDDRACLDCDGQGACPFCKGGGRLGAEPCSECEGSGRCAVCQGDGLRETVHEDFGPYATTLPGICPTCVGGSGLCPDCGTLTKDTAGGTCLTCGGLGVCFDCGGSGLCPHDAADGVCVVCRGSGREVLDGDPPRPGDRVVLLRNTSGTAIVAKVLARPDPNLHVELRQGSTTTRTAFTRAQLKPLSYYVALRDFTPVTDGRGRMEMGTVALSSEMWPLALQDFRRAMAAELSLAAEATAQLREVADRRTLGWIESAERAKKAGDRESAALLLNMVRFAARGTPQATRADVIALQLARDRDEELANLDDAAKALRLSESRARAERTAAGVRMRLSRARSLFGEAQQRPADEPAVDRLLARADQAVFAATRMLVREAYRDPPAKVEWPWKPEPVVREARLVRAEIAAFHAARAVAGGRFDFGARLARRAVALDPANAAVKVLAEAELGLARSGVLRGSPAPGSK